MSEWKTIEIAPRDGTVVHLYRRHDPWDVVGYGYWAEAGALSGWISFGYSDPPGNLGLGHPTHWMPLPSPPAPEREGKG